MNKKRGSIDNPLMHPRKGEAIQGKVCRCHDCNIVDVCTEKSMFVRLIGKSYLVCANCAKRRVHDDITDEEFLTILQEPEMKEIPMNTCRKSVIETYHAIKRAGKDISLAMLPGNKVKLAVVDLTKDRFHRELRKRTRFIEKGDGLPIMVEEFILSCNLTKSIGSIEPGDWIEFAGNLWEVAGVEEFPHGPMIAIYDEPPGKHIDHIRPENATLHIKAADMGPPTGGEDGSPEQES